MVAESRGWGAGRSPGQRTAPSQPLGTAHAPYNFVPLPSRALESEPPPAATTYYAERHTGRIDLRIEALAPLYIRGTATLDKFATATKQLSAFYSPSGIPALPGSSIRGMLRTLVEIVSASSFDGVTDSRYAYRAVAEHTSALTSRYHTQLANVSAGHLRRDGDRLTIVPARRHLGHQYWRVRLDDVASRFGRADPFSREDVDFKPAQQTDKERSQRRTPLVADFQRAGTGEPADGYVRGTLVISGHMEKKKHAWIVAAPDEASHADITVSEEDERVYREGWSQTIEEQGRGRFPLMPTGGRQVPCFYVVYPDAGGTKHVAFGHTRWFRIPYMHSVGDRITSSARKDSTGWDLARSVFGRVGANGEAWAGRLFVEDAALEGDSDDATLPADHPRILSTPKPTTFQHYLEQDRALASIERRDLLHWDIDGAQVRGYKLYWHRPEASANWQASIDERKLEKQLTTIEPVKSESVFRGRVRFENLSDIELGALLFVLELPSACRHRIGMGKPLGLGSVAITSELNIDDRHARYQRLFANDANTIRWAEPETQETPDKEALRAKFAQWLLAGTTDAPTASESPSGMDAVEALWATPRMQALKALLTWDGAPSANQTNYMELKDFVGRPVLPTPMTVLGRPPSPPEPAEPPTNTPVPPPSGGAPTSVQTSSKPEDPTLIRERAQEEAGAPRDVSSGVDALAQRFGGEQRSRGRPGQRQETKQSQRAKQERERINRHLRGESPTTSEPPE